MSINLILGAIVILLAGLFLNFKGSKERQRNSEWSSGLQWSYFLCMVGVSGILSEFMSFTAALLVFVVFTGIVWVIHKGRPKKGETGEDSTHFTGYMGDFFPIILVIFVLRSFIAEPFQIPSSSMRPGLVKDDFISVDKFSYGIRLPTLNKVVILVGNIARGDIVVFNYPLQSEMNYIKRVVGIPGDVVEYRDKVLVVNGETILEKPNSNHQYTDDTGPSMIHTLERLQTALNGKNFDVVKEASQPSVSIAALNRYTSEVMPESSYSLEKSGLENCEYAEDGNDFICRIPEGRYFAMGDNRDNSADSRYRGFVDDKLIVGRIFFVWMNLDELSRISTSIQ